MVTMALAVSAYGNFIPPVFLFPEKYLPEHYMKNATPQAIGIPNESGWMQQADFVLFMKHFIDFSHSSKEEPTLLLLDNHGSHLSVGAIDLAVEYGVTMLSFPPHCSHRMQPLDVSVYGPLKTYYRSQYDTYLNSHEGDGLDISHITGLVAKALDKALSPSNIKKGFSTTGIHPFDPHAFGEYDFIEAVMIGENAQASSVEQLYNDEELRCIHVCDGEEVGAIEEVSTSEPSPSTSAGIPTVSRTKSLSSLLNEIGPMQATTPKPKTNRGRKAMKSSVLTSPDHITALKKST